MNAIRRELIMQRWNVVQHELLPELMAAVGATVLFAGTTMTGVVFADEKAAAPKAAEAQMEKSASKPQSNAQEKTSVLDAKADKPYAAKDKSKHFHPRDGK